MGVFFDHLPSPPPAMLRESHKCIEREATLSQLESPPVFQGTPLPTSVSRLRVFPREVLRMRVI